MSTGSHSRRWSFDVSVLYDVCILPARRTPFFLIVVTLYKKAKAAVGVVADEWKKTKRRVLKRIVRYRLTLLLLLPLLNLYRTVWNAFHSIVTRLRECWRVSYDVPSYFSPATNETAEPDSGIRQNLIIFGTLRTILGSARNMYETVCRHMACRRARTLLTVR